MSTEETGFVLGVHSVETLGRGILGEAASDSEFKVVYQGVEDLGR